MSDCGCFDPQARYTVFATTNIPGSDERNGRYGEVTIERCRTCASVWLNYLVEYEAFTKSGRWFRGLIDEAIAATVTPDNAVAILESLPWHFYGGSYFDTYGARSTSPRIRVDH